MAETQNNENRRVNYDIYSPVSRPFFSYKKPGDGNAYCMMVPQLHSHIITLKFTKSITSENRIDLTCYLSPSKLQDFVNILEGIMARRRDAFASHNYYATDEAFKIPVTRFTNGKEEAVGALTIDTELIDAIARLRITYFDNEKNDSVEIVFNERLPADSPSGTTNIESIDYSDIQAFAFVALMKELISPSTSILYGIVNSAVGSLTRYISACLSNRGGNSNNNNNYRSNNNYRNNNSNNSSSDNNYSDYDESVY